MKIWEAVSGWIVRKQILTLRIPKIILVGAAELFEDDVKVKLNKNVP